MNESIDPLESELLALRPLEMSSQLQRGIAKRLAEVERVADATRSRGPWLRRGILAGGLIAAGLAVVIVRWSVGSLEPRPTVTHLLMPTLAVENSNNMLVAYERAFARSAEEFDALLNKEAADVSAVNVQSLRVGAFSWSDPELHALLGEK
jgi:hypothetical protein